VTTPVTFLFFIGTVFILAGCKESFREEQLIGSWQYDASAADIRLTYYSNHTWVMTVENSKGSVPNGTAFGEWFLADNRLTEITHSTFDNKDTGGCITNTIIKLSNLVLLDQNLQRTNISSFHRVDSPAVTGSDNELFNKLVGTWTTMLGTDVLYNVYRPNGTANWHRAIPFDASKSQPLPDLNGVWAVEKGCLVSAVTNSLNRAWNMPTHKQILFIGDSQFTYLDDSDTVQKALRFGKNDQLN
jgi:hypothetical protein